MRSTLRLSEADFNHARRILESKHTGSPNAIASPVSQSDETATAAVLVAALDNLHCVQESERNFQRDWLQLENDWAESKKSFLRTGFFNSMCRPDIGDVIASGFVLSAGFLLFLLGIGLGLGLPAILVGICLIPLGLVCVHVNTQRLNAYHNAERDHERRRRALLTHHRRPAAS